MADTLVSADKPTSESAPPPPRRPARPGTPQEVTEPADSSPVPEADQEMTLSQPEAQSAGLGDADSVHSAATGSIAPDQADPECVPSQTESFKSGQQPTNGEDSGVIGLDDDRELDDELSSPVIDASSIQTSESTKALVPPLAVVDDSDEKDGVEPPTEDGAPCWMFAAICLLQVLANFDNGVLPSVLSAIQAEFDLDFSQLGLLGALVYVGLVASCPISGYLLTRCGSPRLVLVGSVALNAGALVLFAAAPAPGFLLVARTLIGLSQAPIFIYAPVWVDTFAPPQRMTLWISLLQANVAIGIMLGYVFGGLAIVAGSPESWRIPLYAQGVLMAPFALLYLFIPDRYVSPVGDLAERIEAEMELVGEAPHMIHETKDALNTLVTVTEAEDEDDDDDNADSPTSTPGDDDNADSPTSTLGDGAAAATDGAAAATDIMVRVEDLKPDEEDEEEEISLLEGTAALLCNRLFMLLTIGLTGLYFVVTGIQFWISDYLVQDVGADPAGVVAGFAVTSLTAPTLGVFFGGWLVDRLGGYKDDTGQSAFVTLRVCCLFGLGAVVAAIPAAIVRDFWGILVSVWFVLFFGGALLPAVTGVAISAIPADLRSVGNALSLLTYNLLGYAAAPYLCGVIASSVGIAWGFRVVMMASVIALVPILIASHLAKPASLDPTIQRLASHADETDDDTAHSVDDSALPRGSVSSLGTVARSDGGVDGLDDVAAAERARMRADTAATDGASSSASTRRSTVSRSRRGTVTDLVISAIAFGIGVPDPNSHDEQSSPVHPTETSTGAALSSLAPPPRSPRAPSSVSSSAGSSRSSASGRRMSALHMTGSMVSNGIDGSRRRSHVPQSSSRRLGRPSSSDAGRSSTIAASSGASEIPKPRVKTRRVSGMVAVLGDISLHASRGRAVTSFFHTRHMFDAVQEEDEEESTDDTMTARRVVRAASDGAV